MLRKVYRLNAGNMNRLKILSESLSNPVGSEVLIAVRAIGLNFADVFAILGLYSATPEGAFIPGLEFAGTVIATGDEVTTLKKGDRVMGVTRFGAYVTHIKSDESYLNLLPSEWSFNEGAAYLVQVLTAYYGLVTLGNLKEGMNVLIHSAAGGVGLWANRIARRKGARTIGTVGNSKKLSLLRKEGFNFGLVRCHKTFSRDIIEILDKERLDLIMECIGGDIMKQGWKLLSPMGRMIIYGSAHYGDTSSSPNYPKLIWKYLRRPKFDPQNMIAENKSFMAFNLIYLYDHVHLLRNLLDDIQKLDLGRPYIGHIFDFEQLPDAVRLFQSGQTQGKVVICVNHDGIE